MFICHCGKQFNNHRARNAHQISHKDKQERYSISRRKNITVHHCEQCGIEIDHNNHTKNRFCSVLCSGQYQWEKVSVPKIEEGLGGNYKRYLKETRGDNCALCGQSNVWNNKPLTLQLDHIDGDSDNNSLDNLRLVCPNCHTQTETFGNAGKGSRYKKTSKRNTYLQAYKGR
jgi:endogenous inhibitor of DNA gyrase (YacG/DUF329 family)